MAYRVPAEIMELALPLLDRIGPRFLSRRSAYRQGRAATRGLVQVAEGRRVRRRRMR